MDVAEYTSGKLVEISGKRGNSNSGSSCLHTHARNRKRVCCVSQQVTEQKIEGYSWFDRFKRCVLKQEVEETLQFRQRKISVTDPPAACNCSLCCFNLCAQSRFRCRAGAEKASPQLFCGNTWNSFQIRKREVCDAHREGRPNLSKI